MKCRPPSLALGPRGAPCQLHREKGLAQTDGAMAAGTHTHISEGGTKVVQRPCGSPRGSSQEVDQLTRLKARDETCGVRRSGMKAPCPLETPHWSREPPL